MWQGRDKHIYIWFDLRVAQYLNAYMSGVEHLVLIYLNCTDNYDVVKIKVKSVTDHQ